MSEPTEHTAARLVAHPEPGKVWVQIPHHNDIGSDWIAVDELTSVPPAQPPAAPENDVRLTEAEREAVNVAVDEAETCLCCGDDYGSTHVYEAVERIVAERVRVVEGERDEYKRGWVEADVRADYAEGERDAALDRYAEREQRWHWALIKEQNATARAESAEAALAQRDQQLVDAAREIGTLRAGIEALDRSGRMSFDHSDLRALLAGGAS